MLKEKVKFLEEQKSFRFSPHRKSQLHNSIMPQGFFSGLPPCLLMTALYSWYSHSTSCTCLARPQGVLKGTGEMKPLLILPCLPAWLSPVSCEGGQGIPPQV